jgi:hypothetical protein
LHPTEPVLLVPEGTLNLAGPTRDILAHVDGNLSVAAIVDKLLVEYAGAPQQEMINDVLNLLDRMQQRGVVRS